MIGVRHEGLEELYRAGKTRRIGAGHTGKGARILQLQEVAGRLRGYEHRRLSFFIACHGELKGWSVRVTGNYCIASDPSAFLTAMWYLKFPEIWLPEIWFLEVPIESVRGSDAGREEEQNPSR